jgi:hypothetical protein
MAVIDLALFILQNHTDLEEPRNVHSEIFPASYDTCLVTGIKAEILSDTEEEEYPAPMTFLGTKAEPEVSCFFVYQVMGVFYLSTQCS